MDYRCLELTHESLSDGSFEDTEAGKRNYATCHVLKYRKIRWQPHWLQQNVFLYLSFGQLEMLVEKFQHNCCQRCCWDDEFTDDAWRGASGWTTATRLDGLRWKFRVASRTVILTLILTSLPTIHKYLRMSDNPAHHMQSWGFYVASASKLILSYT